jgi:glycyl-tRNA synthetase beta subunit
MACSRVLVDLPELTGIDRPVTLSQVVGHLTRWRPDAALQPFLVERVRYVLEQRGSTPQRPRASRTAIPTLSPLIARRKLEVLPEFTSSADFTQLATAFKRVRNIARELPAGRAPICRCSRSRRKLALLKELEQRQQPSSGGRRRRLPPRFRRGREFGPAVTNSFTDVS